MGKVVLAGEPMALLLADTPGDLKDIEHFTRTMSGAEVNVSIGLTRLGHQAEYITRLGKDPFGRYIKEMLEKNGILTNYVTFDSVHKTGIQLKNYTLDGSDPYAPYYRKGSAASCLSEKEIDAVDLSDVNIVHVTGILPALSESCRRATFRLIERAHQNHIMVSFDPNIRPSLWDNQEEMLCTIYELAKRADIIMPGIAECEAFLGSENPSECIRRFRKMGVRIVIIKDGAHGAVVGEENNVYRVDGFKVDQIVDTVGAGDGFAAGVLSGLLDGCSVRESVRRGNAIGALQIMNRGDNEGLPTIKELEEFVKKYEF